MQLRDILTNREHDVLNQLLTGKTNKQIAFHLSITVKAVEAHITNIYQKLEVDNRSQAIIKAMAFTTPLLESQFI